MLWWTLEREVERSMEFYHERYHGSLDNLTPAGVYVGRAKEVQTRNS